MFLRLFSSSHSDPARDFFLFLAVALLLVMVFLCIKLTKGFIIRYTKSNVNDGTKTLLVCIHGFGSFVPALLLTNNYINTFPFFQQLYEENTLWMVATILVLFFIFLILIGTLMSLIIQSSHEE